MAEDNSRTLTRFSTRYPVVWRGNLELKSAQAMVQMHFLSGNILFARSTLPQDEIDPSPMRITQRMRLLPPALEEVKQKTMIYDEHCVLLALPCGKSRKTVSRQRRKFRSGFLRYLRDKNSMGVVRGKHPETGEPSFLMSIFPQCDFANSLLQEVPIRPEVNRKIHLFPHSVVVLQKK
ncbi:protein split ends [Trichonephila clavata]|uniref:Protein split ends n=1 Tax=Trichonephila clavata TaxID=2740835 RepID=A0A8X6J9I9_TRICU|nr:protein split ends [Trichonephila clavata]